YTRFEWYPQSLQPEADGAGVMIIWQAQRMKPQPGFIPTYYEEFTNHVQADQVVISILFTIIGNLSDLERAKQLLKPTWEQLGDDLSIVVEALHLPEWVAKAATVAAKLGVDAFIDVLIPFAPELQKNLPEIFVKLLPLFEPLDSTKPGYSK